MGPSAAEEEKKNSESNKKETRCPPPPHPPSSKISSFFGVSVLEMGEEWVVELAGKREKTHAHILCGALDWL